MRLLLLLLLLVGRLETLCCLDKANNACQKHVIIGSKLPTVHIGLKSPSLLCDVRPVRFQQLLLRLACCVEQVWGCSGLVCFLDELAAE